MAVTPGLAQQLLIAHLSWVAVLSVVTLVVYAVDKRRAKRKGPRVRERTLHLMSWMGGAPGGWCGRHWLRHKTLKPGFAVRLFGATVVHVGIAGGLARVWLGG